MNRPLYWHTLLLMSLSAILEAGRRDFLDATRGISHEAASAKPVPERWSVLECIEHVIAVENRYIEWIVNGTPITPQRDSNKEMQLFTRIRSRLTKVEAPEVFRPHGQFSSLVAALTEFNAVRDRSVHLVQERGEALYAISATHPRFKDLNGAELIQLIDGHTRRHADQIREIREWHTMSVRMKPVKAKAPAAFKRDSPDLPADFESGQLPNDGQFVAIGEQLLHDLQRTDFKIDTFQIEGSILERVQLSGGQFGSAIWKDVRFIGCDLANIRAHRMVLLRVEFIDCRLTGFHASAADWQDVLIQNGDARYAQWQGGKFKSCEFDGCDLQDVDLQESDLSGSRLRSCNLARADLRRTKLRNTDFRKSDVDALVVGMNDLQGAIVDASQAMVFARIMGLQIA